MDVEIIEVKLSKSDLHVIVDDFSMVLANKEGIVIYEIEYLSSIVCIFDEPSKKADGIDIRTVEISYNIKRN